MKKIKYPGNFFFGAFSPLVNHNHDLNPKFEQKNLKNKDRTSNKISKGKMAGNKKRKKSTKKLFIKKNDVGYYPT